MQTLTRVFIYFTSFYICSAILRCHLNSERKNVVIHGKNWMVCENRKAIVKYCILNKQQNGQIMYVPFDNVKQKMINDLIKASPKDAQRIRSGSTNDVGVCDSAYVASLSAQSFNVMKNEWRWNLQFLPSVCNIRTVRGGSVFATNYGREFAKCVNGKLKVGKCMVTNPSLLNETKCINIYGVKNVILNPTNGKTICEKFHEELPDIDDIAMNCFDFTDDDHFTEAIEEHDMLFKFSAVEADFTQNGGPKGGNMPQHPQLFIPWRLNLNINGPVGGSYKLNLNGPPFNIYNFIKIFGRNPDGSRNPNDKTCIEFGFGSPRGRCNDNSPSARGFGFSGLGVDDDDDDDFFDDDDDFD